MASQSAPTPPASSFNLADYKETAVNILTVVAPPAAIALRQGKADLDTRHLAASVAMYCSFVLYVPAVMHAYWLLNIRDAGGLSHWAGEQKKNGEKLWADYGPMVVQKTAPIVDPATHLWSTYSPPLLAYPLSYWEQVKAAADGWRSYALQKLAPLRAGLDTAQHSVVELFEDGKTAFAEGRLPAWIAAKTRAAFEKAKSATVAYPRIHAIIVYIEERIPLVVDAVYSMLEKAKAAIGAMLMQLLTQQIPSDPQGGETEEAAPRNIPQQVFNKLSAAMTTKKAAPVTVVPAPATNGSVSSEDSHDAYNGGALDDSYNDE